ncbi:MAG: type IV pilus biogenesis protein PilM [Candidatus Hydrogenedentota bacterium]
MLFGTKVGAIEFDIEHDDVRVAVIRVGRRLPAVLELQEAHATYDTPEDRFDALVQAVDEALSRLESRPAAFVLCASTRFSVVRTITIPFRGRRKVAAAVPFELEPYLAFNIEELLVDFTIVKERRRETDVLAVGSRRELLDEQLAILAACGLDAEAVGLDAAGLTSLWLAGQGGMKGLNAVLHVREHGAIVAVTHNKTLAYFRHLNFTGEQIRMNPPGCVREIQNTLRGFLATWKEAAAIETLHVTGIELEEEDRTALEAGLGMDVHDHLMLASLKGHEIAMDEEGYVASDNAWEAAIGVALGAAGGPSTFDFKRFERDWQSIARGVISHVMFSACLALLSLMGWAYYCYQGAARNESAARELAARIATVQEEVTELQAQGLPDMSEELMQLYRDPPMLHVLGEIANRMAADGVSIYEIEARPPGAGRSWLRIQGEAENVAQFRKVFDRLRECEFMVFNEDPQVRMEETATFTINIDRAEENGDGEN